MRKIISIVGVIAILATTFSSLDPSTADEPSGSDVIGRYYQPVASGELTEGHVSWSGSNLVVEAPLTTHRMKIQKEFIDSNFDDWASEKQFTASEQRLELEGRKAEFSEFNLGENPVFSWGSNQQLKLLSRPMWVSYEQESYGDEISDFR